MRAFINGIGSVSPQRSWDNRQFLPSVAEYHARMIQCMEPEVDPGLEDKYLRRMNRLIRLGWTAAKICLDDAGNVHPDAIITGSGWGSVQDSEKFLLSIYKNHEKFLPPTPFIQSTHNALGSQIAILLENYHYNMCYAHSSFAFEQALQDGLLRMNDGDSHKLLVGGFDEVTPNQFTLYDRLDRWRKEPVSNLKLLEGNEDGTISGEGFSFFLLQNEKTANTYAEISAVATIPAGDPFDAIPDLKSRLGDREIDWVFAGLNGDKRYDPVYARILDTLFPTGVNIAAYKHLCGEYLTSSGFALWAAAKAMRGQQVPDIFQIKTPKKPGEIRNILIFNAFKGNQLSFILLTKPN